MPSVFLFCCRWQNNFLIYRLLAKSWTITSFDKRHNNCNHVPPPQSVRICPGETPVIDELCCVLRKKKNFACRRDSTETAVDGYLRWILFFLSFKVTAGTAVAAVSHAEQTKDLDDRSSGRFRALLRAASAQTWITTRQSAYMFLQHRSENFNHTPVPPYLFDCQQ